MLGEYGRIQKSVVLGDNPRDAAIATVFGRRDASSCAWRATQTREMLESMLGAIVMRCALWNELIIDPNFYMMPSLGLKPSSTRSGTRAEVRVVSQLGLCRFSTAQNATERSSTAV